MSNDPFLTDGISLGIPNNSATDVSQVDNAIFLDSNGNLYFRDNFTKNATDINGNPLVAVSLQDIYTLINGVYVANGQLYFKDSTTPRAYSLQELVGAYINWQNKLTNGGIFWIGNTTITDAECNNIQIDVNGNPNLPSNTPPISGTPRQFIPTAGIYPSYATGTKVFSIDQYLNDVSGNFQLNTDGSWAWYTVPNLTITIPPVDLYKVTFIMAKLNVRLIGTPTPLIFRLIDTTTGVELDRKAVENNSGLPAEQQPVLSFTGPITTYQSQLQQLNCQCASPSQTQALAAEPPHVLAVQFHANEILTDNIYEANTTDILYDTLERRLIGLPNAISSTPIVNSSINVIIFDTTPTDISGRKAGTVPFSNQSTYQVTFDVPFSSTNYTINLSCNKNINMFYTMKTVNGFMINAGKSFTGSVDWIATKLSTQGNA